MARNTSDMNLTPEQNKIFSNLVDMFEGFVPVSTIKETVRQNNYNLDRSLAALLQAAESSSKVCAPPTEQAKINQFKNKKPPSNNQPPNVAHQTFHPDAVDFAMKVKQKPKPEQRPRVQMPYTMQAPGPRPPGYSDFQKNTSYYQGSPLQYQPTRQLGQTTSNSHFTNAHANSAKNLRPGAPVFQGNHVSGIVINTPAPNHVYNCHPPSSFQTFPIADSSNMDQKNLEMAKTYEKVYKTVDDGYKIMVLMRGCPGSGKSHAAHEIIRTLYGNAEDSKKYIFSADDFFINVNGVYNFNPELLGQAHQSTQAKVLAALKSGITPVIIDNTNTQTWEMKIYASMAVAWGYYLEVLEPLTSWKWNAKTLTRKSTHNIPLFKVRDMLERYEQGITGEKLLQLNQSTYSPLLTPPQLASNSPKKKLHDSLNANTKSVKVGKAEEAVNKNVADMMHSFFKNNPCAPTQEMWTPTMQRNPSPLQVNTCQPHFTGSGTLSSPCSPINSQHFPLAPSSLQSKVFGSMENLRKSKSQTGVSENQVVPTSEKVKKTKNRGKRKKIPSRRCDVSKDYILVMGDQLLYQRDYSILEKDCTETKGFDRFSASDKESKGDGSSCPSVTSQKSAQGRIVSSEDIDFLHSSSSSVGKARRNSVSSCTSTLNSLVNYSNSDSSSSDDESDELLSSSDDDDEPTVMNSETCLNTKPEHSGSTNYDLLNTKSGGNDDPISQITPFDETQAFSSLSCNTDFLKTWETSLEEKGSDDRDKSTVPKPPRKRLVASTLHVPDDSPSTSERTTTDSLEWTSEDDVQAVLQSWGEDSELSAEKMVEKLLRSLLEPSDESVSSLENKNGIYRDMATSTDYEQVLAALQGSSSDCKILKCCSRDINSGLKLERNKEPQQRLHLDKGSMTEDCIPIVLSSSVDVRNLSKVFSPEVSDSIVGLIDYCNGDINEVISSLIDSGHEITSEQFEILASIPKNCLDVSSNAELDIPIKKETRTPKVATELPKQKVKQAPTEAALKLKEELESKIKINPSSYPKYTQQLKKQKEQQEFPTISESMKSPAPDESLVFVLDENLINQLQQKFGTIDLPYIKDFRPVVHIPSSLAFQLYGCVLVAAEENVLQQERLMQDIIASDQKLAKQLQESEINQNRSTELVDIMDMKLALQLYNADLKAMKMCDPEETVANVLSRQLLYEMFPQLDQDSLSAMYRINRSSFHDTVQMVLEKYQNETQIPRDLMRQKKELLVQPPSPEALTTDRTTEAEEPSEESLFTVDDYIEEQSYHYQMRTKCFNQAREAYNSGKSQVASYFSQLAFLHKQKMEKASSQIIKMKIDSNSTDTLDLHFFATKDALLALDIFLDNHIRTLRSQTSTSKILYLITGQGSHSSGGVPKVKPAVMKRLQRRNILYKIVESNPGLISISIHKNLKLSSHFQDDPR